MHVEFSYRCVHPRSFPKYADSARIQGPTKIPIQTRDASRARHPLPYSHRDRHPRSSPLPRQHKCTHCRALLGYDNNTDGRKDNILTQKQKCLYAADTQRGLFIPPAAALDVISRHAWKDRAKYE